MIDPARRQQALGSGSGSTGTTGTSMSTNPNETQQTVIQRTAPFIEDYTRRLIDPVFALGTTPRDLPQQGVAPLSSLVTRDLDQARGLPSFLPFLTESADIARGTALAPTAAK